MEISLFLISFLINFALASTEKIQIKLHTFGDSHSHWNIKILNQTQHDVILLPHPFYGKTLHGIITLGKNGIDFSRYNIDKFSIVMFNFGEIDSRNHLHKFLSVGIYSEIKRLVSEYEKLILLNLELVPEAEIWIGGLVPPKENPLAAHLGSNQERLLYNRLLNDEIFRMAKQNQFVFLDNFKDYANEYGFLNSSISDGHIHIKDYSINTQQKVASEIENFVKKNHFY